MFILVFLSTWVYLVTGALGARRPRFCGLLVYGRYWRFSVECDLFFDFALVGGFAMGLVFFWLRHSIALVKVTQGRWSRNILKVAGFGVGCYFLC